MLCGHSFEPSPQIGVVTAHAACTVEHVEKARAAVSAIALVFMVQSSSLSKNER